MVDKREMLEHESSLQRDIRESENRLEIRMKELESRMKEMETVLRKDIEILRAESKKDIAETKAELVRWVVSVGILQFILIAALLLKLLHQI